MLRAARPGATFLLNSSFGPGEVWDQLPRTVQKQIIDKKLIFYVVDGYQVAEKAGMGRRINTIMQTCFFAISGILPREEAIGAIKKAIEKTYGKRGEAVVKKNFEAVDMALGHMHEVAVPAQVSSAFEMRRAVPEEAPEFVQNVLGKIYAGYGDDLPVSAFPPDGTFPTATAQWEKRNIALEIPVWDEALCIQCGKCVLVCPHAVIRAKVYDDSYLGNAPATFKAVPARWKDMKDRKYTLQVAPEDCTGCTLCVEVCPSKSKSEVKHKAINMAPQPALRESEAANWGFFLGLPETDRKLLSPTQVKDIQLLRPLFEFSGACSGCGETPYLKLVTQLFGDRVMIANATGCTSIYGANLPTTPWTMNAAGRGPAWNNSLFEDNAEFGLGMRLGLDAQHDHARQLLTRLAPEIGEELVRGLLDSPQDTEPEIELQRARVERLREKLASVDGASRIHAQHLLGVAGDLVRKGIWIVGGDGWAYDIGFGGLDQVLSSGRNVNILVLDTEVYSNTGGQASKSTPRGAVAKFAAAGKATGKKDLGAMARAYGNVYVAQISMGANDAQTTKALLEAEAWPGVSLVVAYATCIAHGIDMEKSMSHQKDAVKSGYWPLYRYQPSEAEGGQPFKLDSAKPSMPVKDFVANETRYAILQRTNPVRAAQLAELAQADADERYHFYEQLAGIQQTVPHLGESDGETISAAASSSSKED
jgi:pyruvate-ferredoxin/flavodoxin oxidoreductase